MPKPIEYADASAQVRAVFDDIKRSRDVPDVNNFWKYLARDPALLKRTWESVKEVMAPGVLDPLVKEMSTSRCPSPMAAGIASPATPPARAKPA